MTGVRDGAKRPISAGRAFVAARIWWPIQAFVHTEASSGVLLLAATIVALVWANSPWDASYADLWHARLRFDFNRFVIDEDLGHLVNDGLMAIFFFVVGLEIKRELVQGELASPRRAALPVVAALGGMVVPALIYTGFAAAGGEGAHGWGIPMATDIAFSLGVLALLGSRAPFALKVFLLALAIVDDLGAIVVIAVFYTESIAWEAVAWGVGVFALVIAVQRAGVRTTNVYVVLGALFWVAVLKSGIHATVAGVLLAMVTPATPLYRSDRFDAAAEALRARFRAAEAAGDTQGAQAVLDELERLSRDTESPLARLERRLHPWVSYAIVPVFALANAGVVLSGEAIRDAIASPVSGGVVAGLVLGKPIGVFGASALAVRAGIASLPDGVRYRHLAGAGMLAGVGFTVSLFITGLAFDSAELVADAKIGILAGSLIAGVVAFVYLWLAPGEPGAEPEAG